MIKVKKGSNEDEYISIIDELCNDSNKSVALKACLKMIEFLKQNQQKTVVKWFIRDKDT